MHTPRSPRLTTAVLAATLAVSAPLAGAATASAAGPRDRLGTLAAPAAGFFGPSSVWRTPVDQASVNGASAAMTANLASQVQKYWGGTAALNVWQSNESMITAAAGTRTTRVIFDDCQGKGYTPAALYSPGGAFLNVPIPANAVSATGTDAGMAIYSPSTNQLWSFWKAVHRSDGWHACWGGRIDGVSTSPGYFLNGGGATATGLSSEGGAITIRDAQSGVIRHAMSLAIPNPAKYTNFSWPAQRSDGSVGSTSNIPEGTRFRLSPSINVASLNLSPMAKMIAVAAQRYGFIVTDKAGAVSVITESGNVVAAATGQNPWSALLGGTPSYQVMANFPWSKMQALPADWGRPGTRVTVNPLPGSKAKPRVRVVPPLPAPVAVPAVTGISPKSGPAAGGTMVTVTGRNLAGATDIAVGLAVGNRFSCSSTTTCRVRIPAVPAGTRWHSITVTTKAGTSPTNPADVFTYVG